ncbi:hypothetical protein [Adhaeribacter soli]|nr:hypothetical protein [Adhaeribacter soli]
MDNHLAAGWCWLQRINIDKQYNLLHIDRHYDLLHNHLDSWVDLIEEKGLNLSAYSIDQLVDFKSKEVNSISGVQFPLFRYDNYIPILNRIYPNLFAERIFATHKNGEKFDEIVINKEVEIWELPNELERLVIKQSRRWIVNLDIDYFFIPNVRNQSYQFLSDEYIISISKQLKKAMKNIEVFTIALSPEFCGKNWDPAMRVCKMITDAMGIELDGLFGKSKFG